MKRNLLSREYCPASSSGRRILRTMQLSTLLLGSCVCSSFAENSLSQNTIATIQQQARTVQGKIVDNSGEPIIGVNVVVKGTTVGTITDFDGNFSIEADSKSVLTVSYIGFLTKEIPVGNQKTINIVLTEDTKALDEVVVIGYGTQKKADLTGSVANVSTEKLNTQSNTTIGQALQGKIAGVDIVSQGGAPGGSTRVMVRGIGTLNNSSPLYIVGSAGFSVN